jgi:hypothetical protein
VAGFATRGLRSHVLLTACGANEFAIEREGRGVFTEALVKSLMIRGAHNLTYKELLRGFPNLPL